MKISVLSLVCFLAVTAADGSAQYLYLDADGDGHNEGNEVVPRLGWAGVDVWLDTSRNRDGSLGGPAAIKREQGVAEYSFVVKSGSPVEWGTFTPAAASMRIAGGPRMDSLMYFVGVHCQPMLKSGRQKLGQIRLRARWGQGSIGMIPCAVIGEVVGTSFRMEPAGQVFRLGPTIALAPDPTVVKGEWQDVDGASFSLEPRGSAGPVRVSGGYLYLGWNRMASPYELRIDNGRVVVNGLTLPLDKPRGPEVQRKISAASRAMWTSDWSVFAVGTALHRLGSSDSASLEGMATAYRLNSTVESVRVSGPNTLAVLSRGSAPIRAHSVSVGGWEARGGPARDPNAPMASTLEQWSRLLNQGGMVQIFRLGHTLSTGALDLDHSIVALQRGEPLSPADSTALKRIAHSPEEWEAIRHPARLERLRP